MTNNSTDIDNDHKPRRLHNMYDKRRVRFMTTTTQDCKCGHDNVHDNTTNDGTYGKQYEYNNNNYKICKCANIDDVGVECHSDDDVGIYWHDGEVRQGPRPRPGSSATRPWCMKPGAKLNKSNFASFNAPGGGHQRVPTGPRRQIAYHNFAAKALCHPEVYDCGVVVVVDGTLPDLWFSLQFEFDFEHVISEH